MNNIQINNFSIKDLEQAIRNVLNEKVIQGVSEKILHEKHLNFFSREQTAKMLCISLPTLNQWTKQGIVKAYRISGRVLYKLEDINEALVEIETSVKRGGKSC